MSDLKDFDIRTRIIDTIVDDARVPTVSFTGGEPTLRPDLPDLIAYAKSRRLRTNLITNAISFCEDDDAIGVWAPQRENSVLVVVEDTGPGIPADRIEAAFEPFERLGAESSAIEGTGVGLALVLFCDLRFGAASAKFTTAAPKLGLPVPAFLRRRQRADELAELEARARNIGNALQHVELGDMQRHLDLVEEAPDHGRIGGHDGLGVLRGIAVDVIQRRVEVVDGLDRPEGRVEAQRQHQPTMPSSRSLSSGTTPSFQPRTA